MALMNEAIDRETWEKIQKGIPVKPKPKIERPEPEFPVVPDLLKFEDIPMADFDDLESAGRRVIQNNEGVHFNGFDVRIILTPDAQAKRKPGRPKVHKEDEITETVKESKVLTGWMIEGDFQKFHRIVRERINQNVIKWF